MDFYSDLQQSQIFSDLLKWCYQITTRVRTFYEYYNLLRLLLCSISKTVNTNHIPNFRCKYFSCVTIYLLTKRLRCHQNWLFMVLPRSYCEASNRKKNHDVCHSVIYYKFSSNFFFIFTMTEEKNKKQQPKNDSNLLSCTTRFYFTLLPSLSEEKDELVH